MARDFLTRSSDTPRKQFRSHLLLRAIILLLEAPENCVSPEEFKYNAFRYGVLVHATGLAPSQTIYPLLERAKKVIARKSVPFNIYHLDYHLELRRQIKNLSSHDFERLIKFYYESLNFKVEELPEYCPALDLIAISKTNPAEIIGIQVKMRDSVKVEKRASGQLVEVRKRCIHKDLIPDEEVFDTVKAHILDQYKTETLSKVYWYTIYKIEYHAYRLLARRVAECFGQQCELRSVELDELVNLLWDKSEVIRRVQYSR